MSVVWASFFKFFFLQPMEKCSLMVTRESVGRLSFFFQVISFCNQWKSAAWWLQDRMSVVWDTFFKFSFSTNGKVQLDGYKIGCQLCELLFSSSFFCNQWKSAAWWLQDRMSVVWASFSIFFFFNQWKSAAWWLQDRMSVVWVSFFKFFLQPMDKCSLMVTRWNVGRVSFFFLFYFFATNGQVQLDGYKIECRSCELLFSFLFFCNQWKSAAWWL